MKSRLWGSIFIALFVFGAAGNVLSETANQGGRVVSNENNEPTVKKFDDWFLRCTGEGKCTLVQMLLMGEGDQAKRLLETSINPTADGQEILQMTLPFGVDLRAGIAFRVDENEEIQAGFVTCLEQGCIVRLLLTEELKANLKKGDKALVGFRSLGASENTVIEVSLKGISAGMEALVVDRKKPAPQ